MLEVLRRAAMIISTDGVPNYTDLAAKLGAPRPALYVWHQIPARYVLKLEEITDGAIMRWEIRRDLHPPEDYVGRKRRFELRETA